MSRGYFSFFFILTSYFVTAQSHNIGFDRVVLLDSNRHFGPGYRPIVINCWYPSETTESGEALTYRDYISATSSSVDVTLLTDEEASKLENEIRRNLYYFGVTDEEFNRILLTPAQARSGIEPTGRYPLVVIVGGTNGSNALFTSLAEHYAAQGMVVATFSSFGTNDTTACGYDIDCAQHQVNDLSKVVDHFKHMDWIDEDRISMIAWSFGGLSAWAYTQQETCIRKIVSFDSALGYQYGVNLIKSGSMFDLCNHHVSLLHFQSLKSGKKTQQDMSFLKTLPNDMTTVVRSRKLLHAQFTSLYGEILNYGRGISDLDEWKDVLVKTRNFLIDN